MTSITEQARKAAEEIARELNGGDRADCSYPTELMALIDDPSIDNEAALAKWAEVIIAKHIAQPSVTECVEAIEEVLDAWNADYEQYALSGAPTGSAAKEQVNRFAGEIISALESLQRKRVSEPWEDSMGHQWEIRSNVQCVECPHCLFTFSSIHTTGDGGYECPNCDGCAAATPAPEEKK